MKIKNLFLVLTLFLSNSLLFGAAPSASKGSPALAAIPESSESDDSGNDATAATQHSRKKAFFLEPAAKQNADGAGNALLAAPFFFDRMKRKSTVVNIFGFVNKPGLKVETLKKLEGKPTIIINYNSQDNEGKTPLMHAVLNCNEPIVKYLVEEKKVELNTQDNTGATALILAIKKLDGLKAAMSDTCKAIASYLIDEMFKKDRTIGLSIYNNNDETAYEIAQKLDGDLFQKLFKYGAKNHPKWDNPSPVKERSPNSSPRKEEAETTTVSQSNVKKASQVLKNRKAAQKARAETQKADILNQNLTDLGIE